MGQFFSIIILGIISIITPYVIKLLRTKCKEIISKCEDTNIKKHLTLLSDIISECVLATKQTYVDSLKGKNIFTAEEQKIAFEKTYKAVQDLLTEEAKKCLEAYYNDLDLYISERIEAEVQKTKS